MSGGRVVCAVDAGASWSKGALFHVGDQVRLLAAEAGGPGNPNAVGRTMATSNLSGLLLRLHLAAARDPRGTSGVCVGVSTPEVGRAAAGLVMPGLSAVCVPDVELLVAGRSGPTVAVVAGTGSMAARADGAMRTFAGGHGWFLGDEGSATALGRDALTSVLSGAATTALRDAVAEVVGAHGASQAGLVDHVYGWVYRQGEPQRQVPRLAPVVTALAAAGDVSARELLDGTTGDLLRLAGQLGHTGDDLVFGGSVAVALADRLGDPGERWGSVTIRPDGVAGAAVLATAAAGANTAGLLDEVVGLWDEARTRLTAPWQERLGR